MISSEQADIRTYIREMDPDRRASVVAKMLFLHILGENVSYGQMEVLTLMSQERYSYKRIGYVAAAVLLDETSELTVLLTHTVLKDLQSNEPRVQSMACDLIANIGSPDMCQSVAPEVQKLIEGTNPKLLKSAAMAAVRIVDRVPEAAEGFKASVQRLLKHGSHGVIMSAVNLMIHVIEADSSMNKTWTKYATAFTKILKQMWTTKPTREFGYSSYNDPFIQMKLMKVLGKIKRPSDELDDVLESIATGVEIKKNTGRALLFQAVETIVQTAKKPSLRGLAFSQVGRLFQFKEANVLYSALSVFSRVLYQGNEIIGRTSGDSIALQRYKTNVVKCLNHRDASVRRRALDVVSALVDEENVQTLIPEVMDYVKLADAEFRVELVAKIFTAVQRFAPDKTWNFNTVHRILIENGNYVGSDIITSVCKMISHEPSLQPLAVKNLAETMKENAENQTLMQVTAWILGEYATTDNGIINQLATIISMPQTSNQTKGYIITALAKLASRLGMCEQVIKILENCKKSNHLDVQQRAGEMILLLNNPELRDEVLLPLVTNAETTETKVVVNEVEQETDLLLIMDDKPAQPVKQQSSALSDLLSLGSTDAPAASPAPQPIIKPPPGAVEALRKPGYVVFFEIRKNPQNPKQIAIRASCFNLESMPLNNFALRFGVPTGWMIQTQAASGNVLEPLGGKPILQQLMVYTQTNTPLAMKAQITYLYGSQPITETADINPIFA